MIVFVEGVDGSGKSTLCNELNLLNYDTICIGRHYDDPVHTWQKINDAYADSVVICDRSFITDLVYRLQDKDPRSTLTLTEMCDVLRQNAMVIHCKTDSSFTDAINRGEDNIRSKSQADRIKHLYDVIIKMFNKFEDIPVLEYNWKTNNVLDVVKFIEGGRNGIR